MKAKTYSREIIPYIFLYMPVLLHVTTPPPISFKTRPGQGNCKSVHLSVGLNARAFLNNCSIFFIGNNKFIKPGHPTSGKNLWDGGANF